MAVTQAKARGLPPPLLLGLLEKRERRASLRNDGLEAFLRLLQASQDEPGVRTFVDREIKRGAGGASLRIGPGSGDGMAMQPLAVPPLRLAKISFWARTSNFSAVQYNVELRTLEYACANRHTSSSAGSSSGSSGGSSSSTASGGSAAADHERCSVWMSKGRRLSWWSLVLNATQEWTRFEYTAPCWSEPVGLFLGIEDRGTPQTGSIWFDSVEVEETALLNVVRRDGAPLALMAEGSAEPLVEGKDFSPVSDPFWEHFYGPHEAGESANLHEVPSVRALPGGRLRPGQRVTLDYYALSPVRNFD